MPLRPSPLNDRLRFALAMVGTSVLVGTALRLLLHARFHAGGLALAGEVLAGALVDALVAVVVTSPLLVALALLPARSLASPWRRGLVLTPLYGAMLFLTVIEFYFFEEFDARFNRIALDYVLFPHEVFVNIWESYDVPLVVALCLAVGALLAWASVRATRGATFDRLTWPRRLGAAAAVVAACVLSVLALRAAPASLSDDRVTTEIAQNDLAQLVRAYATAHLDYPLYYRTLPTAEARTAAASYLGMAAPARPEAPIAEISLVKSVEAPPRPEPLDVVIVLEESLGSEFVGALGDERGLTPGFDRWAGEGLLLTNLVPTGNRTVRGLEGTLCSFVPLPGDAVVKRNRSDHVATIAGVLSEAGYATCFAYGGVGFFDDMKPFLTKNGYREFIEQSDYPKGTFKTAWGVADEFIFEAALARQREARAKGERLLMTVLTVSNHKPFDVPPGRVACSETGRSRACAVSYADWALARYLDSAKEEGLLDGTVVLALGDHGARVYGSARIPTASYRIPGLLLVPDARWKGRRMERLCSQVDLAPTVLSLAGVSHEAPFFGEDLTRLPPDGEGRAFVHHNRDVGLMTDRWLVVLGLGKSVEYYSRTGRDSDVFTPVAPEEAGAELRALERDATAVFQTAYELYEGGRLALTAQALAHRTTAVGQ